MIKKIAVSVCLLFSLLGFAQQGTSSPYSFYGIGDVKFKGTAENRAMGGLTIFPDSIHLNLQNPASYSSLRYTTLSLGASFAATTLETETQKEKAQRVSLDYFAVGIPMGKFGAAFGLMPYSSVGYRVKTRGTVGGAISEEQFQGTGGINRAFLGLSYNITPKFSIGAEAAYNFGQIETSTLQKVDDVQYATRELSSSDIGGFSFTAGAMYNSKLNEKLSFYSALSFATQSNLQSQNERELAVVQLFVNGQQAVIDKTDVDVPDTKLKIPSRLTFGAGIGENNKWMVGAEVAFQQSQDQNNRFTDINSAEFENGMRYTLGGYFIPKYNSFTSYFSRVTYRGGLRYENTGLVLNNKSINDAGFSVGLGLPVGGSISNINLGFEYGKRGTVYNGLVRETYANVILGISLNDRWFVKRKFD